MAARGCVSTWTTYAMSYELFYHHGPRVLRFPLKRANAPRFFSSFVACERRARLARAYRMLPPDVTY